MQIYIIFTFLVQWIWEHNSYEIKKFKTIKCFFLIKCCYPVLFSFLFSPANGQMTTMDSKYRQTLDLNSVYVSSPTKVVHLHFVQIHLKPYQGYKPLSGNSSPFGRNVIQNLVWTCEVESYENLGRYLQITKIKIHFL